MRIACGRARFKLNVNLLDSLRMHILNRIRVDRPYMFDIHPSRRCNIEGEW